MLVHKELQLVLPEALERLGLPAEAPAWVSPWIRTAWQCERCGATYEPLVYAPGRPVRSCHRKPACPGIYHYHWDTVGLSSHSDVLATVRPDLACVACATPDHDHGGNFAACAGRADEALVPQRWHVMCAICGTCNDDGNYRVAEYLPRNEATRLICAACVPHISAWCAYGDGDLRPTSWTLVLRDGVPTFRYAGGPARKEEQHG